MILLPMAMLQPSAAGLDDRIIQSNGIELEREAIPRGVPLRQRQLPASFWQEPNRMCPPPPAPSYGPMHVVADPATTQRMPAEYVWPGMSAVPGTGANDFGYGPGTAASVLPNMPCSCPHCTEKHYRAAQMAYPWSAAESEVKSRVDGWMWPSPNAKAPTAQPTPAMPSFQNPYGVPVSVGTSVGMGTPMDVGDAYAAGHQGPFWKASANGTVSSAGYWSLPYSFNWSLNLESVYFLTSIH